MNTFKLFLVSLCLSPLMGCLVQYYAESDIEGLPCDSEGLCEAGYFCKEDICTASNTKQENDACDSDEDCSENLYCIDMYENCAAGEINCDRSQITSNGKRCRRSCDPYTFEGHQSCPDGHQCHTATHGTERGFCQEGTCQEHSDCGSNIGLSNFCLLSTNGIGSGLCVVGCDPFNCVYNNSCNDCPASAQSCEPTADQGTFLGFGCYDTGNILAGSSCNLSSGQLCTIGAFCLVETQGSVTGTCRQYCAPGGGNPACPSGDRCLSYTTSVGYCAP
jgi:hypothetical protein